MIKSLLAVCFVLFLCLCANTAFAQSDVITDTVVVDIDGVDRVLTVTFAVTGVVSVDVTPMTDTFELTATRWLSELFDVVYPMSLGEDINAERAYGITWSLFEETERATYPAHYAPFVRQYRFTVHTCTRLLDFYSYASADENDMLGMVTIGVYHTLYSACYEQYQDTYIEFEHAKLVSNA